MRLLICAGGTGGGVYPALAVLKALKSSGIYDGKRSNASGFGDLEVLWVGSEGGMEAELIERQNIPYESIPSAGIHGVGWRVLPGNIMKIFRGIKAGQKILNHFQPEVMFFTGGYVAIPLAIAGQLPARSRARPRNFLYVPDIEPGLALRMLSYFADRIAVTVEDSINYFSRKSRVFVTGYPVRAELKNWTRDEARRVFNFLEDYPVIFVYGGSKGARSLNQALFAILPELLEGIQVIHVSGRTDWSEVEQLQTTLMKSLQPELAKRYRAYPYLHDEMGAAFAAADLVISRAGASILGELPFFGVPAILVPYPYAWQYQQVNARYLQKHGAAEIVQDNELHSRLLPLVRALTQDLERLKKMRAAMLSISRGDAAKRIAAEIQLLAQSSGGSI